MRLQPVRVIAIAVAGLLLAVGVVACGSSSGTPGAASARPASPTSAAPSAPGGIPASSGVPSSSGTGSAATAQIKADWREFFSARTPVATRISLLQNGPAFASILRSQASSPLAASAASTVSAVTVESPAQAKVTYSIVLHGTPALKHEPGTAIHQNGTWKVGDQSFCALLILESSGKAPAACASAAG